MAITYPKHLQISDKMQKIFNVWEKNDPISKDECKRYRSIKKIQ